MPRVMQSQILYFFFFSLIFCPVAHSTTAEWHYASDESAVALSIHGLNMKPQKMDGVIKSLNSAGVSVLNLTLEGHGQSFEKFKSVNKDKWVNNFNQAYIKLQKYAQAKRLPLYLFGYSTGATVALAAEMREPSYQFNKRLLMSPALKMTWLANAVRVLFPFEFISLPSSNRNDFKVHNYTPIPAYKSLFSLADEVSEGSKQILNRSKTLIVIDPKDELVSFDSLAEMAHSKKLDQWTLHKVFTQPDYEKSSAPHHAIIHEFFTGPEVWSSVSSKLKNFLKQGH